MPNFGSTSKQPQGENLSPATAAIAAAGNLPLALTIGTDPSSSSMIAAAATNDGRFNFFAPAKTQLAVEDGRNIYVRPIAPIEPDADTFEFILPPSSSYLNLRSIRLHGSIKVVSEDGKKLESTADFSTIQQLPLSMWKLCSCLINGCEVQSTEEFTFAYKSFIESVFTNSTESRNLYKKLSSGFIEGKAGTEEMNNMSTADAQSGYMLRAPTVAESKSLEFCYPLSSVDLFRSERLLLPGCSLRLRFSKSSNSFMLMSSTAVNYKVQVEDLYLEARVLDINPTLMESHARMLSTKPALYPFRMGHVNTRILPSGVTTQIISNVAIGTLPQFMMCGLVDSVSFGGSFAKNPFRFHHNNVSSFSWVVNGVVKPSRPYTPDYAKNKYLREFLDLVENLGLDKGASTVVPLSYEKFAASRCFYSLNTSGDANANQAARYRNKVGSIDINLSFATPTTETLHLVIYSIYDKTLVIDHARVAQLV